jgi:hypothetical protein
MTRNDLYMCFSHHVSCFLVLGLLSLSSYNESSNNNHNFNVLYNTLSKQHQETAGSENDAITQSPPLPPRLCPSLYQIGGRNEHSPMVWAQEHLLIYRTPSKVGSTLLKGIYWAQLHNQSHLSNSNPIFGKGPTLDKIHNQTVVQKYLYGDDTTRLLFSRHPVTRILAGFLELATRQPDAFWKTMYGFNQSYGHDPEAFAFWLTNSTFTTHEYDAECGRSNSDETTTPPSWLTYSLDPKRQHWLPAQHCRCGMLDCGVKWTMIRIEDERVEDVMARYLDMPWLWTNTTSSPNTNNYHSGKYNASAYLTNSVLDILNLLTKKEQDYFGYQPFTSMTNASS